MDDVPVTLSMREVARVPVAGPAVHRQAPSGAGRHSVRTGSVPSQPTSPLDNGTTIVAMIVVMLWRPRGLWPSPEHGKAAPAPVPGATPTPAA